jgi:hypothetical protein
VDWRRQPGSTTAPQYEETWKGIQEPGGAPSVYHRAAALNKRSGYLLRQRHWMLWVLRAWVSIHQGFKKYKPEFYEWEDANKTPDNDCYRPLTFFQPPDKLSEIDFRLFH